MTNRGPDSLGWREYQKKLQSRERRIRLLKRFPLLALCSGCAFLIMVCVLWAAFSVPGHRSRPEEKPREQVQEKETLERSLGQQSLLVALRNLDLDASPDKAHYDLSADGVRFRLYTTLDTGLQDYTLRLLQRSKTLKAAVVVLNPVDGRILAMADYAKDGKGQPLCRKADFPAASLFKIVSAAAALESAGFTPEKTVAYQGRKYTLYKEQLKEKTGRYASRLSFRKAFASSINPVFGRLGIYHLGQEVMNEYASRFLFNQAFPFDLPVSKSTIQVPDDDFGLAEIASGFNKRTLISPLHAALMASAVANGGMIMTPWMVERILNGSGEVLYRGRPGPLVRTISRETAQALKILMGDTVRYGTCRKAFRRLRRKRAFKDVELGAKTGTINDELDRFKYDWITAYALPPEKDRGICIAVLGVHGEKLGIRSKDLARYIMNKYFN